MAGNENSGRRMVPAVIHQFRGNPSKKPIAELTEKGVQWEMIADSPVCPAHLDHFAREEWDRIAPDLYMLGLINKLDQAELAVYCQAYSDWRRARMRVEQLGENGGFVDLTPNGFRQIGVWMQIANRAEERMRSAGASFGLNPSARAKARLPTSGQGELFDGDEKSVAGKYFS
jgi:P27 family predicted phage terminase small subunit